MLSARVALANGTVVTASKCSHPDLFWSLRGGGGGVAAVVLDWHARSHPAPQRVTGLSFSGSAATLTEYHTLFEEALKTYAVVSGGKLAKDQSSDGGFSYNRARVVNGSGTWRYSIGISLPP